MEAEDRRQLLVIDTDVGSDDALALLLALGNSEWDVVAITSVHGNVNIDQASENALRIIQFCGKPDIPIYKGCDRAIVFGPLTDAYHGEDGLGGHAENLPEPTAKLQEDPAAVALVRLARKHYKKITLIALGPLTNLALAHRLDAKFSHNLKELFIMGGNIQGKGNVTACAEFNFNSDPEAADVTLREFECRMTIVPWEVCATHLQPWEWYEKWISKGTKMSEFVGKASKSAVDISRHTTKSSGFHCCDLLAMTALLHPQVVTEHTNLPVRMELHGGLTRGLMVPDWRSYSPDPHNVTICTKMDTEVIQEIWNKIVE